ncbi:MAG: hypothetical protein K2G13_05735, partial [Muribaculaceae bacterium]|nr:hypothetical protein [Muribaculaceae bacterium]
MNQIDVHIRMEAFGKDSPEAEVLASVVAERLQISRLLEAEKYMEALERTISALQRLKDFQDHENEEFKALLVALVFDLAEIHFMLKDFKRSEKELDALFKVLDPLVSKNPERFGRLHILAMELSTRILRSKKKTIDMLARQQLHVDALTEKVNSGINSATDRLVDSLCNVGRLLASSGDYREAMKFFSEAIRISKKRTGRVNRKEIKMTVEMAEIMIRVKSMRPRAERLLDALLPHAISLGEHELEQDILTLKDMIKL